MTTQRLQPNESLSVYSPIIVYILCIEPRLKGDRPWCAAGGMQ